MDFTGLRKEVAREIERLQTILKALEGLDTPDGSRHQQRRAMSIASREKIAAAQRRRWAKWKANKKK